MGAPPHQGCVYTYSAACTYDPMPAGVGRFSIENIKKKQTYLKLASYCGKNENRALVKLKTKQKAF